MHFEQSQMIKGFTMTFIDREQMTTAFLYGNVGCNLQLVYVLIEMYILIE